MPQVARLGDIDTGHGCWPSRPNTQGSENVYVNNIPAHRQGDAWAVHTCPSIPESHGSVLAQGSSTVYVNNKQLGYVGAPVACGGTVAQGSNSVYVGE